MKKNNKVTAIIILVVIMFTVVTTFTGCEATSYEKRELNYTEQINDNPEYVNVTFQEFNFKNEKEVKGKWKEKVDYYANDMVDFLNQQYEAKWEYWSIQVYAVDLKEAGLNFSIGGIFDPSSNCIYLDRKLVDSNPDKITPEHLGFVVHEILHYLKDSNTGTPTFCLKNGEKLLGFYLTEGLTNFICEKYLLSKGEEKAVSVLRENGYASIMHLCREAEISIPELIEYYCKDDIKSLEKDMNKLGKAHIKNGGGIFEVWLSQIDKMYMAEHEFKRKNDEESYERAMLYVMADTEIIAAITEQSNSEKFLENFQNYDEEYYGGIFKSEIILEYLTSLFYEEAE